MPSPTTPKPLVFAMSVRSTVICGGATITGSVENCLEGRPTAYSLELASDKKGVTLTNLRCTRSKDTPVHFSNTTYVPMENIAWISFVAEA